MFYHVKVQKFFLTLREEHRRSVFENMVLRGVFGPKWEKVTGGWRILYKKKSHDMYSPNISWVIK